MAFLRYAHARSVRPHTTGSGWDNIRVAAAQPRMDRSLVDQASKILKKDFDPADYLLSHATIVASVDAQDVPGVRLGAATVDGRRVMRKTTAYRVKPECEKYINNNFDCFSRPVMVRAYPTFSGAHNFLEHVQIEDLSKGRILDAVARDIGDSVYVDILIATDRKHAELIRDIESGELTTLSMGCSIDGSTCTKCGHWAADETEFCECVRYYKGNTFYDEQGNQHRVAELCGDETLDPTGGVTFIEASWVKVPAFKGAVARNILTLSSEDKGKTARRIQKVMGTTAPTVPVDGYKKAANLGGDEAPLGDDAEPPVAPAPPPTSPLKDIEGELRQFILDNVQKSLKEELSKSNQGDALAPAGASMAPNDTLVKQARVKRAEYLARVNGVVRVARTDYEVIQKIALLNQEFTIFVPGSIYRTALKVGGSHRYGSLQAFLSKCQGYLGRTPTLGEARTLVRLAKLITTRRVGVKPKS